MLGFTVAGIMRLTPSLSVPPSCVPLERTGSGVLPFPLKPRPCAFPCLCLSSLAVPKKLFPIRGVFFWGWIRQLVKSLCQRLPIRQTRLELQDRVLGCLAILAPAPLPSLPLLRELFFLLSFLPVLPFPTTTTTHISL